MAKKAKSPKGSIEWENKLPAAYRTLVDGFHSELNVKDFADYIGTDATVPAKISHIKIRSFTPKIFKNPELAEFWESPVSLEYLKEKRPSVYKALHDDDVREVQKSRGYDFDPKNPTNETLARLASTQELGYKLRMAELVRDNLVARLERLKDPVFYANLLNSPYVKRYRLQEHMPKDAPKFKVMKNQFNVKHVKSALRKAYAPRHKDKKQPDNIVLENFIANPDAYGNERVRDALRTSIDIGRDNVPRDQLYKRYNNVRNALFPAIKSGELGMVCDEFVDSVNYPPSEEAKDVYPTGNIKGKFYHAGLNGTLLSVALEIQIPFMRDDLIKQTHENMEFSRELDPDDAEENALNTLMERQRRDIYDYSVPANLLEKRNLHLTGLKIAEKTEALTKEERQILADISLQLKEDPIGALIVNGGFQSNGSEIVCDANLAERRAAEVALKEFPEEYESALSRHKNGIPDYQPAKMDPGNIDKFRETMDVLVKKYPEPVVIYTEVASRQRSRQYQNA